MTKKTKKSPDWRSRPRPYARKPEGEKRCVSLEIPLTFAERDAIREAADRMGIAISELCRQALAGVIKS